MKEKNFNRKQAMKKAREVILHKKALHKDVANFMIELNICMTQYPLEQWQTFLQSGFKGYYRMRGKELVKTFDHWYAQLRKEPLEFYNNVDPDGWNRYTRYGQKESYNEEQTEAVRTDLLLKSDALMSRLMELAFNLDFDE